MNDKPKRKSHWNLSWTVEREAKIEKLRQLLSKSRTDGERIHGTLTTAQLLDWGLDALLDRFEYRKEIDRLNASDD